jgi:ketosteroid isomerase-like protein
MPKVSSSRELKQGWAFITRGFSHRNYRLFCSGQSLSLIGSYKMNRVKALIIVIMVAACAARNKPPGSPQGRSASSATEEFAAQMQNLRDTWVQEFNAGHAEKVAAFYAPDAVLMRWDGSVHGYDSILTEFQRSVTGGAHDYVVHSLHAERSGDVGYDTGAYNVTLRNRVVEGNYLIVVKRVAGQWKIVAHASVANPSAKP